jgi:hypothetical protein
MIFMFLASYVLAKRISSLSRRNASGIAGKIDAIISALATRSGMFIRKSSSDWKYWK